MDQVLPGGYAMFFRELRTERCYLKNIGLEDDEFILKQFSNDDVNQYLYDAEPYRTIEEAQALIRFYNEEEPRNQHRWILVKKDTGEKIGTCGFHCWNRKTGVCELGYDLYPDYQKKGYMTEALSEIIAFAKTEMQLKKLEAHIYIENINSVKTVERLGFIDSKTCCYETFRGHNYRFKIYIRRFD